MVGCFGGAIAYPFMRPPMIQSCPTLTHLISSMNQMESSIPFNECLPQIPNEVYSAAFDTYAKQGADATCKAGGNYAKICAHANEGHGRGQCWR